MTDFATQRALVDEGLQSLEERVQEIMEAFADMLRAIGKEALADHLPWQVSEQPEAPATLEPSDMAQLYSIAFQLLDMVEERVAMTTRREREKSLGPGAEKGLWPERLQSLKALGIGEEAIAKALTTVRVEPVFTAHPTEAKRTSVRERHRVIYQLLLKLENPHYTSMERELLRGRLLSALEALWFTGEIHVERPTIKRELRNALFYLREMFPDVIGRLDQHLAKSWEQAGFDPRTLQEAGGGSQTRFGMWIGGDRDGHPFVTADVTRETLATLRSQALELHRAELRRVASHLTVSLHGHTLPASLDSRIQTLASELGEQGKVICKRHAEEPWRAFCHLLGEQLAQDPQRRPTDLLGDLSLIEESLEQVGCSRLGKAYVQPLRRKLDVFGFHLAILDVRQNSAFHDEAAEQLLAAAGIEDGASFSEWPEARRVDFLTTELESARPLLHAHQTAGIQADAVRDCYRVLAKHWNAHNDGLGALIVSMTRQVSDLLLVHLFARESGLVVYREGQLPTCPLQVAPLLETLTDLRGGAAILEAYLQHPMAQRSLALQSDEAVTQQVMQQVMLGYSDSNKDAGILASQVGLHRAQREIFEAGQRHGAKIHFFHGRGGTVSRGAGPVEWFVKALPQGSLHAGLRMTEQGETIAAKYAHLATATFNLELLQACSLHAGVIQRQAKKEEDPGFALIEPLAESSQAAYRRFIEREHFLTFFRQATPIDALEQTRMGSRPSRRTGAASLDDLRAIPWVFSWTQARFYLPGWYGVGSALERHQSESPKDYETLIEVCRESTFARYVFTNVESSLASSNLELMRAYAGLVEDESVRHDFMNLIEAEREVTQKHLSVLFPGSLEERRPRFYRTLALREIPLRTLHLQQIRSLAEWRREGGDLPNPLVYMINAISSGLRTTG